MSRIQFTITITAIENNEWNFLVQAKKMINTNAARPNEEEEEIKM